MDAAGVGARAARIRRRVLEMAFAANKGHIGSALSIADIVAVLTTLRHESRDGADGCIVLSKGHAASALFAGLADVGVLEFEDSDYCADGSAIATHPMAVTPGIDFSTGSLGQGITFSVGVAMANRLQERPTAVWCVLSDSELNEGSTWEAAQLGARWSGGGLVVILDLNGQQATGRTNDVLPTDFVPAAWAGMGWEVREVDGHDVVALWDACRPAPDGPRPILVVARTVAGRGVAFMEGAIAWHYLPMSGDQFRNAVHGLGDVIA